MKINPEHYATMQKAIQSYIDARPGLIEEMIEMALREPNVKDHKKLVRWNLSYLAGLTPWICNNIYPYANDDHIDTALKRITNLY